MIRRIVLFFAYLKAKFIMRGVHFKGMSVIFAFPKSKIEIGEGTYIQSDFFSNLLGLYQRCIIIAKYGGEIIIGKNCGLSGATVYAFESIRIGNDTLIGVNCKIVDNDFHPTERQYRKPEYIESHTKRSPVIIGDNCFIGMNSIILKGTKLGNNVIVGAGSVVHGTFPDNCIIAGNPARIIKENIV